ncbi:selenium-binding protein SBP56-related protein [Sphaerisporangium sp. TRM90804]|uniref:selenium-binding protein SBP56-related protein n=1 Tax=Sphaerisporangium sp. TRM90804 TaxID=3031113 RepID=UPI002449882C|nr:selenium-binding protein SBP56-related protein [Sphaerisporangium sp. TRM90804]MDH2428345.1 selenium-binding protein SBP56-related protein [Sphaerisporangium sp. TRM90804]
MRLPRLARRSVARLMAVAMIAGVLTGVGAAADAKVVWSSEFRGSNGTVYTATNHLVSAAYGRGRQWLLAWAGPAAQPAPDFLAVIDATPGSSSYGKVVNTVTVGPNMGNEPHHLQYVWHKGDHIYAGGIISDTTFVFDTKALPSLRLVGVNVPTDTPCGTLPDAYHVLKDGTAYGTYMGGPDVTGPCTYTNGEVRVGNGAAGSPGEIVRIAPDGRTLAEIPAATAEGEDPEQCGNIPALPAASCANPHGLAVREDLNIMVVSDFAEARNFLTPDAPLQANLARQTVRVFDITDRNDPVLKSVTKVSDGPRGPQEKEAFFRESRVVMEVATTNKPGHKGAFVSSMAGGAVFYTPDVTAATPKWREVLDDTAAYRKMDPRSTLTGGGDNSSWLAVSPDDRYLFHTVMGQSIPYGAPLDVTSGMLYVLDIRKLLASGNRPKCSVDQLHEVYRGGSEHDCPELVGVVPIRDTSPGGPHWGTMDIFDRDRNGIYRETDQVKRIAAANYFVNGSFGGGGDHRVCMFDLGKGGRVTTDNSFRDENTGRPCVSFNRASWPHGDFGDSQPHGVMFAVSDSVLR